MLNKKRSTSQKLYVAMYNFLSGSTASSITHVSLLLYYSYLPGFCQKLPSPINVSMGSTAEFHCSCQGGNAIVWYIGGELVGQEHSAENGINYQTVVRDGFFTSTLSINATERNNNSRVECGLFQYGHGVRRFTIPEIAILRIQGEMSACIC